jgi:hypothetical protein
MNRLLLVFLLAAAAAAQTHTVPALDTNNHFTGLDTFDFFQMRRSQVAGLGAISSAQPVDGLEVIVTDGKTGTDCTAGGGSTRVLCHYNLNTGAWQPLGGGSGSTILDASVYPGIDMCGKINSAIKANPGAIIDARAFSGVQLCSTNPFAGQTGDVVLLLGEVYIQTTAPWVTNSQYMAYIYGAGRGTLSTANPHGTTIKAMPGFPASCDGLTGMCPVIRLGDFSAGTGGSFGQRIENLAIDCNSLPGSIGLYSNDIQEQSGADHFLILQCPVYGVYMDGSYGQGKGAENYTLYDGEVYSFGATTANTVELMIVGSNATRSSFRVIENVTASGSTSQHSAAGYRFTNTSIGALVGLNSEQNTIGYDLGPGNQPVQSITMSSITCGQGTATCVWIHAGSFGVSAWAINNGGGATTVQDDTAIPGGNTITDGLLDYSTGDNGAFRYTTSHYVQNNAVGNLMPSLYINNTAGQTNPFSVTEATDTPLTMTFSSGKTSTQGVSFIFADQGVGKWGIQNTGGTGANSEAYQIYDFVASVPRLFFSNGTSNNGYDSINAIATGAVTVNSAVNSGTGGFQVCSGGASPVCNFRVAANGTITTMTNQNGFTGTKTAGACVFTITNGIITNVTGC